MLTRSTPTPSLAESQTNNRPFTVKGIFSSMTVFMLHTTEIAAFSQELQRVIAQAPKLFSHALVVIDLQAVQSKENIDFTALKEILTQHNLIPIAVCRGTAKQLSVAKANGWINLPKNFGQNNLKTDNAANTTGNHGRTPSKDKQSAQLITQPVRSGQQIFAKDRDLIVLNSVSAGAEVLADGHIHVYGTLRGRAIAGASGNTEAHIFCHRLCAELVSIAGFYMLSDEIQQHVSEEMTTTKHVSLHNQTLSINNLS